MGPLVEPPLPAYCIPLIFWLAVLAEPIAKPSGYLRVLRMGTNAGAMHTYKSSVARPPPILGLIHQDGGVNGFPSQISLVLMADFALLV